MNGGALAMATGFVKGTVRWKAKVGLAYRIPGAVIEVQNQRTGEIDSVCTDHCGNYALSCNEGLLKVTASNDGFHVFKSRTIFLRENSLLDVDFVGHRAKSKGDPAKPDPAPEYAEGQADDPEPLPSFTYGEVHKVQDAATCPIDAAPFSYGGNYEILWYQSGVIVDQTVANGSGIYQMMLDDGTYDVVARKPGGAEGCRIEDVVYAPWGFKVIDLIAVP